MDIKQVFAACRGEFLKCQNVTKKLHARSDLCAFLILDRLVPGTADMIQGAEHDEIFLDVCLEALEKVASEEDIRDLVRCGVMIDDDGLTMFV